MPASASQVRSFFADASVGDWVAPWWLDYNSFEVVSISAEEVSISRIGRGYSLTYSLADAAE